MCNDFFIGFAECLRKSACNRFINIYVTVPEKRTLSRKKKNRNFNSESIQRCVKTLNDKTLYARSDGRPNLPYSSRAIEVKNEKTLIKVQLPVWLIFPYT